MRLPFLWVALGFSVGIVVEKYGKIPALWPVCVLSLVLIPLWFLRGRRLFLPLFILCLGCAGFLWARIDARVPANAVQNFTGPERITLRGVVETLPEMKTRGKKTTVSLVLKVRSITRREGGRWKFHKVSGDVQVFLLQSPVLPQVGDELRLYGELSVPRTVLNPGEFDYGNFLAQKNIHAVFQTIGKKCVRITKTGNTWAPARMIAEMRRRLAALIDKLYRPEESAILKALVLGLRSDVSPEVRNSFFKSGTIHLLAISGLNITMIAGTFYLIFLCLGIPYRITALLTILIVWNYVGLAGAGIPVQRAGYGAILVLAGALIGRPSSLLNVLCFALCSILLWSPMSLWNIGLQLSFLSVFSLILVLPLLSRFNAWMLSLGSSLAVLLGTFPVILFYFNIFSPVSILANLAAIPLFDGALFTALFALIFNGVPFMGIFFARISSWILGAGLAWVRHLSFLRGGYWFFERPGPWLLMAYYACLGLVLFFHKKTFPGKRWLMTGLMVCWLTVTAIFFIKPDQKRFEAAIFASGRNQVLYARFANGAEWLLNAGRSFPSDQGEWLIVPFLRGRGSRSLEGIAFTDLSRKHTGGMGSVLRDFPARFILYPSGYADTAREIFGHRPRHGSSVRAFQAGNSIHMEMETVRVLACSKKGTALMIETGPWRLLLVSRWDAELFTELLKRWDDANEIHAVFLPALDYGIPPEFRSWFDRVRPILTVSYKPAEDLERFLASRSAPSIDLEHSGALFFRREGLKLTLSSYVKGSMGFYSYH